MLGRKNMSSRIEKLLHRTLGLWREWENTGQDRPVKQPEVIEQLTDGLTNQSFMVSSGDFKAVLRINSLDSFSYAVDRDRETLLLKTLQPTGCVPRLLYADADTQVTEFIEGRYLTSSDITKPSIQAQLEDCFRRVHSLTLGDRPRRNYLRYSRFYSDQLAHFPDLKALESVAKTIDAAGWDPVISHHDLLLENILYNDHGIYFLDWEYADLGHPLMDHLRVFGVNYCAARTDRRTLDALVDLDNGLAKLWYAVKDNNNQLARNRI
jgi:thiamine kinase